MPRRKGRIRWGTLGAIASAIGGVVVTIVSDPHVLQELSPRIGLSVTMAAAIIAGVKKSVDRDRDEPER